MLIGNMGAPVGAELDRAGRRSAGRDGTSFQRVAGRADRDARAKSPATRCCTPSATPAAGRSSLATGAISRSARRNSTRFHRFYERHGNIVVFVCRFIPFVRGVSALAGRRLAHAAGATSSHTRRQVRRSSVLGSPGSEVCSEGTSMKSLLANPHVLAAGDRLGLVVLVAALAVWSPRDSIPRATPSMRGSRGGDNQNASVRALVRALAAGSAAVGSRSTVRGIRRCGQCATPTFRRRNRRGPSLRGPACRRRRSDARLSDAYAVDRADRASPIRRRRSGHHSRTRKPCSDARAGDVSGALARVGAGSSRSAGRRTGSARFADAHPAAGESRRPACSPPPNGVPIVDAGGAALSPELLAARNEIALASQSAAPLARRRESALPQGARRLSSRAIATRSRT